VGNCADQRSAARATSNSLVQLYLRHEQKHHHRGQTLAAAPSAIRCPPQASQLTGRAAERGAQLVHHQERRSGWSRHEPERPETVLGEGARADAPAVDSLPWCVLGRDRENAAALAPDHRALVEGTDDLWRLGVDQACSVQLIVRKVLVAPAVGEPLAEPGAGHLPAQLGLEALACRLGASSHRPLEAAQLGLQVSLQRVSDGGNELHVRVDRQMRDL
jgi:hypothetical protein